MRSPPAAKNVATTSTTTKARTAKGSRSASRGIGVPALSVLAARRARSIWARHNATEYESSVGAAISSAIAVAGRCGGPVGQVHLRKRESAQDLILTRNYMGASGQKEGTH